MPASWNHFTINYVIKIPHTYFTTMHEQQTWMLTVGLLNRNIGGWWTSEKVSCEKGQGPQSLQNWLLGWLWTYGHSRSFCNCNITIIRQHRISNNHPQQLSFTVIEIWHDINAGWQQQATIPKRGVVRSRKPFKFWWAPTIFLGKTVGRVVMSIVSGAISVINWWSTVVGQQSHRLHVYNKRRETPRRVGLSAACKYLHLNYKLSFVCFTDYNLNWFSFIRYNPIMLRSLLCSGVFTWLKLRALLPRRTSEWSRLWWSSADERERNSMAC